MLGEFLCVSSISRIFHGDTDVVFRAQDSIGNYNTIMKSQRLHYQIKNNVIQYNAMPHIFRNEIIELKYFFLTLFMQTGCHTILTVSNHGPNVSIMFTNQ